MTPQKFYLVCVLIEHSDYETTDFHQLYANYQDALKAKEAEIEEGMLTFSNREGEVRHDLPHIYEWLDDDGNCLIVAIEEMIPK